MRLSDLQEKRATLLSDMKTAHEANQGEKFGNLEKELCELDAKISRAKALDAADRADMSGIPLSGDAKLTGEIRKKFSLARAIAGAAGLPGVDNGFEREVQADLARRAAIPPQGFLVPTEIFEKRVITSSGAGDLIATDHRDDLYISALSANTIIRQLGCTLADGLVGNVTIPRESGATTAYWVGDNSTVTASDATFDDVTLSPKHLGTIAEYSRNMILQSSPAIEGILRNIMAREIVKAIDKAAIRGGGSNQPVGLLGGMTGVQQVVGDTDLFTATADAMAEADIANVDARRSFLSDNVVKKIAAKALDKQTRPIGIGPIFHDEPVTFSNLVVSDANSPDNHGLIYGDWSQLLLGTWSVIDILVNPYESTAYSKGNISVRAMATVDVNARHPEAFVSVTGVTSTFLAIPA
jgi:HK97 family phage major capsid protein